MDRGEEYPIGVLIEELRGEDLQVRLQSIRKIATIALALGPEKTRSQLIPFLTETIYDEDEVLLALAEQLGTLVPYVGGPEYAHSLLPPLESLAAVEETVVRDKAVEALRKLAPDHTTDSIENYFNPLLHRLANGDWFTSRTSACALFSVVYPRVRSSERWELLDFLRRLARDETPMVRRAVAARLGELALAMCGGSLKQPTANGEKSNDSDSKSNSVDTTTSSSAESNKSTSELSSPVEHDKNGDQTPPINDAPKEDSVKTAGDDYSTNVKTNEEQSSFIMNPIHQNDDYTLDPENERNNILTVLVPIFIRLVADEQESVRLMAVESVVQLAQALGPEESEEYLIDLIQQATTDKSWRVRCVVADKFTDIQLAMGQRVSRERLVPFFMKLLHDEEAEVRAFAAGKVKSFARCLLGLPVNESNTSTTTTTTTTNATVTTTSSSKEQPTTSNENKMDIDDKLDNEVTGIASKDEIIMQQLLPAIKSLTSESNTHVKSALAGAILGLAPLVGKASTIEHLLPIFLAQLNDDNPEVRLNVISNLEQVNSVIGIDHLETSLLPAIVQLAEDPKWRVRLAIIEYMPLLAEQLGLEFFGNQLTELCLSWLVDQVYAIREAAVENLVRLCIKFGPEWASNFYIPKIIHLSRDENYLHRMICLQSIISLCKVVSPTICCQYLLPTVLSMHTDNVPNVRFKVAQALSNLGLQLDEKDIDSEVKACLNRLAEDSDTDVKFYAYEAMDTLKISVNSNNNNKPLPVFQSYHIKVKPALLDSPNYITTTTTPTTPSPPPPVVSMQSSQLPSSTTPDLHQLVGENEDESSPSPSSPPPLLNSVHEDVSSTDNNKINEIITITLSSPASSSAQSLFTANTTTNG
ncbi:unnamed protein product [Trichobilharzia szidati]|nr:unnamed protein product [Trichobilharzia szidati]